MLARGSWLPHAERLPLGRSRRVDHDCGEGRTLRVEHTSEGYRAWCFRCNDGGHSPLPEPSAEERIARLTALRARDEATAREVAACDLPMPAVRDVREWPDGAATWLFKAGLSTADIGALGIYYCPEIDRVVLPVFDDDRKPLYWQARALDKWRPKYIGPTPKPASLVARWGSADAVTLTEDMLSAIKVGLSGGEGLCLFGTAMQNSVLAYLLCRMQPVNVWLDPDPAGQKAANRVLRQLAGLGLKVRRVASERDPKLHTRDEIRHLLQGGA